MAFSIRSALAVTFSWTTAGTDISLSFPSGTSPVNVSVPTGSYRMGLAPLTGSVTDFIRQAEQSINDEMAAQGRGEAVTLVLGTDGRAVLSIDAGTFSATLGTLLKVLGWNAQPIAVSTSTAALQPRFIAYFVSLSGGFWNPRQDGAVEQTAGGNVYSFGGINTSYMRECDLEFIPWNPTRATEAASPATPFSPDDQYLTSVGSTATARAWSLLDVLWWAPNASCALAVSNWQALLTSTTERYFIGRVLTLLGPRAERFDPKWPRYVTHKMSFVLPTTSNTGTRA